MALLPIESEADSIRGDLIVVLNGCLLLNSMQRLAISEANVGAMALIRQMQPAENSDQERFTG